MIDPDALSYFSLTSQVTHRRRSIVRVRRVREGEWEIIPADRTGGAR